MYNHPVGGVCGHTPNISCPICWPYIVKGPHYFRESDILYPSTLAGKIDFVASLKKEEFMNIKIEKVENGYIIEINNKKHIAGGSEGVLSIIRELIRKKEEESEKKSIDNLTK